MLMLRQLILRRSLRVIEVAAVLSTALLLVRPLAAQVGGAGGAQVGGAGGAQVGGAGGSDASVDLGADSVEVGDAQVANAITRLGVKPSLTKEDLSAGKHAPLRNRMDLMRRLPIVLPF
jgi:hypothetical protein